MSPLSTASSTTSSTGRTRPTRPTRRPARLAAVATALTLALGLAACGEDHESRDVAELKGSWMLDEFDQADVDADPLVETTLVLDDGQASGNAGVNTYTGTYQAEDGKISFSQLEATKNTGPENAMRQEQAFLSAMQQVENFEYDSEDHELDLKNSRDQTLLVLRRQ